MTIMNQKEDVIDLVLTLKGRRKLAEGKLKPAFYQFYDNEIVYDKKDLYSGSVEPQNDIVGRIQNTQILRTQNAWQGPYNYKRRSFKLLKSRIFMNWGSPILFRLRSLLGQLLS